MKLKQLKTKVYGLSETTNTRQLKAKYEEIRALDLRRKASWEQAIAIIEKQQQDFQNWLANPPEEYQALFAEIDVTTQAYGETLAEVRDLGAQLLVMGEGLEAGAEECQQEANQLRQELETRQRITKQTELN